MKYPRGRLGRLAVGLLLVILAACTRPEPERSYYAYCTCEHGGDVWRGPNRHDPETARADVRRHNERPHHCATLETAIMQE